MKLNFLTIFIFIAIQSIAFSQEILTTKDGKSIILNQNGTWEYFTSQENFRESSIETVRTYLESKSWRDRLPLIIDSDKMAPIMESRYGGRSWNPPRFSILTKTEPAPSKKGWVKIQADVEGKTCDYYLKKFKDGYRIDWETSVGSNPMSVEEFQATKPITPIRFRVLAKLDNYYNFEFKDAQGVAWSIFLTDGGGKRIGHGYVDKNTPTGKDLFSILKNGKEHPLVVEIKFGEYSSSGTVFFITKIVNRDGWWIE